MTRRIVLPNGYRVDDDSQDEPRAALIERMRPVVFRISAEGSRDRLEVYVTLDERDVFVSAALWPLLREYADTATPGSAAASAEWDELRTLVRRLRSLASELERRIEKRDTSGFARSWARVGIELTSGAPD